jgi:pyruvate formate lyase activating enzyme
VSTGREHILQSKDATAPIYSITPFTLLDFADKAACILWFAGCNMRCLYCYNPDIVRGKGRITFRSALDFLDSRKNLLDGVVLSGGECTMHKNMEWFLREVKANGFLVKIDTNGTDPNLLRSLIAEGLVDYIALDYKANPAKFARITQSELQSEFEETLRFLAKGSVPYEVRTTVHSDLLDTSDLQDMARRLYSVGYRGKYYLQHFMNDTQTIGRLSNSDRQSINSKLISEDLEIVVRN